MHAGNYLYANEKGISGLDPEAQNRIYTDMMQVSLEDLKELYSYHLDLLSILQLKDWLWASGNLENKKAYDFVFDIAKQRKQTDYFLKLIETTHQK